VNVTVLGAGAWGTALARVLQQNDHRVTLWGHDPAHLDLMARARRNDRYLPGIDLPAAWIYEADLGRAVARPDAVVVAVPSKAIREVTAPLRDYSGMLVSVTKGIEYASGLTMSGVLGENAPAASVAALSGPSLAMEVARDIPTAIVAAGVEESVAVQVQQLFHRPAFRVYTSADILGVELGGALKNVVAIAAGVGDGLGFGANSKASLLTRGIVEIRKLGVACGALAETFSGLSGLGDLTVTCFSELSRNRTFGEQLGRGESLDRLLDASVSIVEGYPTARSARQLARKHGISTPIIDEVHAVLYEGKNPARAVADLMGRESKAED
jgi:glycerol-3-phosphate dehydrogenase (NAD(P)+)